MAYWDSGKRADCFGFPLSFPEPSESQKLGVILLVAGMVMTTGLSGWDLRGGQFHLCRLLDAGTEEDKGLGEASWSHYGTALVGFWAVFQIQIDLHSAVCASSFLGTAAWCLESPVISHAVLTGFLRLGWGTMGSRGLTACIAWYPTVASVTVQPLGLLNQSKLYVYSCSDHDLSVTWIFALREYCKPQDLQMELWAHNCWWTLEEELISHTVTSGEVGPLHNIWCVLFPPSCFCVAVLGSLFTKLSLYHPRSLNTKGFMKPEFHCPWQHVLTSWDVLWLWLGGQWVLSCLKKKLKHNIKMQQV